MDKNADIQALRGVAILMVMIQHYRGRLPTPVAYEVFSAHFFLWAGVDLFFVISGFVIAKSLMERTSIAKGNLLSRRELREFWIRRYRRLAPASWFWLLVALALSTQLYNTDGAVGFVRSIKAALAALTATADFYWAYCATYDPAMTSCQSGNVMGVYWSLSLEEQFYLLLSLSLFFFPSRVVIRGAIAIFIIATIIGLIQGVGFFSFLWATRPQGLVLGVLLGLTVTGRPLLLLLLAKVHRIARIGMMSALSVALVLLPGYLPLSVAIPLMSVASAAVLVLALPDKSISTGPVGRFLQWVGYRSYSLYLCHLLVYLSWREFIARTFGASVLESRSLLLFAFWFPLAMGTALLAAHLSYQFIERPFNVRRPATSSAVGGSKA